MYLKWSYFTLVRWTIKKKRDHFTFQILCITGYFKGKTHIVKIKT